MKKKEEKKTALQKMVPYKYYILEYIFDNIWIHWMDIHIHTKTFIIIYNNNNI